MRSLLFVPGDDQRKIEKSASSGADVLILDLEDSVALGRKAEARKIAAAGARHLRQEASRALLYVRINALDSGLAADDLDAVMAAEPDGIMLPKSQSGDDVSLLAARIAVREAECGIDDGKTRILPIATETARSLFHLGSYYGASRRLIGMTWGGEDLSADLGAETNRGQDGLYTEPYRLARNMLLFAAAGAGVAAIDSVYTQFRDLEGLEREATEARRDGFSAKLAIHPAQVPVINRVFTPSAAAVEEAQAITALFAANPDAGVLSHNGAMVDRPHLRRAERILAAAKAAGV